MTYVLDTNIFLYKLGGQLLNPLPTGFLHASVVTEIELLSYGGIAPAEEADILSMFSTIVIVDLTEDVKREAIKLRRAYRLKLPDAIVAATALTLGADLISNDKEMSKLANLRVLSLPTK